MLICTLPPLDTATSPMHDGEKRLLLQAHSCNQVQHGGIPPDCNPMCPVWEPSLTAKALGGLKTKTLRLHRKERNLNQSSGWKLCFSSDGPGFKCWLHHVPVTLGILPDFFWASVS